MAAGMRALARKNGISGEMEETMEMRFGESERSELRRVPSISEQMALKVMDEGSRGVLTGVDHKSSETPSFEI
jgi:hypothetical protein